MAEIVSEQSSYITKCFEYLKSKKQDSNFPIQTQIKDEELVQILDILLKADPKQGENCEWIINQFVARQFLLEDVERVNDDLSTFFSFSEKRKKALPSTYSELKKIISKMITNPGKLEKSKGSTKRQKTESISKLSFQNCYSYFKNIKSTLKGTDEEKESLFKNLQDLNPYPDDMNICIWILNQVKNGEIGDSDLGNVKKEISNYIAKYKNLPLPDKYDMMVDANNNDIEILATGNTLGNVLIPLTEKASCKYGSGTKWCTAANKNNMYKRYTRKGPLIIWIEKGRKGGKYQFSFETGQLMDELDDPITQEKYKEFKNHPILSVIFEDGEKRLLKHNKKIYEYIKDFVNARWPEAEPIIMKDADMAYNYANDILKSRWSEAEEYIIKNPYKAIYYAIDVIKGRWPEDKEKYLMNDPRIAAVYASEVIKDRWPEAEDIIIKHPGAAYNYAVDVIKGRWPDAEKYIMKDPLIYARYKDFVDKL